jgi:regulator of sigma E protease
MLTVIAFIIVLGILVFVHELGHFIVAKLSNVKVLEFGFGYPPRLFGIRKGETTYSINLLPLGGFVKMLGEEDPSQPRSLAAKPAWIRFLVLVAGSGMNVLLPLVLFTVLFMIPQTKIVGHVTVQQVAPESPAATSGMRPGDVISAVNGRPVENNTDLAYFLNLNLGKNTEISVERFGGTEVLQLVPRFKPPEGEGATGIVIATVNPDQGDAGALDEQRISQPFWKALPNSAIRISEILIISKNEITKWVIGASSPKIAGPIGIAQMTGEVARFGLVPLVELTALLSINLAILNMLPIPMLDGGRLLFVFIEVARGGHRIPPRKEGFVHLVGFMLLLSVVAVISYYDILRLLHGERFLP